MKNQQLLLSLKLTVAFIFFTAFGTLCHELGHIIVAKILGIDTILHYASMNWNDHQSTPFNDFLILLGGPTQTMSFGIIGFILLIRSKKEIRSQGFQLKEWCFLFLGMFWLREIFNLLNGLLFFFLGKDETPFGGDEHKLNTYLELPYGFISISLAVIALTLCAYMTLFLLPKKNRVPFITAGIVGGIGGYWIWLYQLGPILLP